MFTISIHFLGEMNLLSYCKHKTQIALVCQNVLSTYNLKNVKLCDGAVSWQIATLGLPNAEI